MLSGCLLQGFEIVQEGLFLNADLTVYAQDAKRSCAGQVVGFVLADLQNVRKVSHSHKRGKLFKGFEAHERPSSFFESVDSRA